MLKNFDKVDKLVEKYTEFNEDSCEGDDFIKEEENFEEERENAFEVKENLSVQNEVDHDILSEVSDDQDKEFNQIHREGEDEVKSAPKKTKKSNNPKIKKELRKKYEENIKKFFYKQSGNITSLQNISKENQNDSNDEENKDEVANNSVPEDLYAFTKLKKLKKKSEIIKEKEISKKVSFRNFFEVEAELGSDNEEHDDIVKNIKDDEIEEENDEEDLKDLICNNIEEFSDEEIKGKFFSDMLQRDREELKKVIDGPKRKMLSHKRIRGDDDELSEDNLPLHLRIKRNKADNIPEEANFNLLLKNFESFEKTLLSSEENQDNDEYKEMVNLYQHNLIKKLGEKSKEHKINLLNRMKENDKILENVINLNSIQNATGKDRDNKLFVTGINLSGISGRQNVVGNNPCVNNLNNAASSNLSNSRMKMGFLHSKNSFLHAMKNDKYYTKLSNEDESLISGNNSHRSHTASGTGTAANNDNNTNNNSAASKASAIPYFMKTSNQKASMISNSKSSNLSCLFTRSSKQRHNIVPQIKKMRTPNKNDGNAFNLKKLLN